MKCFTALAAVFVLNAALSFHNVWPTPWITLWPEVSVEAFALILFLAAYLRLGGQPSRGFLSAVTFVLFLMVVGRYLEVTAPALYGRAINLYWDIRYVPDVAAMLADSLSPWSLVGIVAAAVAAVALIGGALFWTLAQITRALDRRPLSVYLPVAAAATVLVYLLGYNHVLPTLRAFSIPVTQTYARQIEFVQDAIGGRALAALPASSQLDTLNVDRIAGRDVIVTFVESYGATAFDVPSVAAVTEQSRHEMLRAIEDTGREIVSAYVESTTFGGGSWLAHISFMTGIRIDDNAEYNAMLTQERSTLPKLFRRAGYRAVAVMPGLKNQWPEGAFYGFDQIYGEAALDYHGPDFGWWRIPDQYTLAQLRELELGAADRAPAFVFFPTISTHAPFRPTPPYQADWHRLMGAMPFPADALDLSAELPQGFREYRAAYADSLAYTYRYWAGYLRTYADDDSVFVILGDHQPPATVSGVGVRWDVPVHVISRDIELAARLREDGFVSGITPGTESIGEIQALAPMLLR